jgi:aspartate-semialdehyde dehydrogenase
VRPWLKALDDVFGVEDVAVTTFQSLSGRGDAKYPRDVVMGNVYPLHGTVERTVGRCALTPPDP